MSYWDASALVPLLLEEPMSAAMRSIAAGDLQIVTWWGTEVECASALMRAQRDHPAADGVEALLTTLTLTSRRWQVVAPTPAVKPLAVRMLRVHALRAGGALHLAAASIAAQHEPGGLGFVCLDARLRAAAGKEGFPVLPA